MERKKVYEADDIKVFGVDSKTIVYRNINTVPKSVVLVPKWILYLSFLALFALISIFVSAFTIVYQAPDPGNYLESCKGRSCNKDLNMKCINDICSCTSSQYFINKCYEKNGYMESCSRSYQCQDDLTCRDSKCQCDESKYYIKSGCVTRKTYEELCKSDQCMTSVFLYCNDALGKCRCPTERFWDGSACVLKRYYNERCTLSSDCDGTKLLSCQNYKCLCDQTHYYLDITSNKCVQKLNEGDQCLSTTQCLGDMTCLQTTNQCQCASTQYFSTEALQCKARTLNNTACTSSNTCRVDLGLSCQNYLCQCDATSKFWLATASQCVNYLTYGDNGCTADSHCIRSQNLMCLLNQCVCSDEYYWDNSAKKCTLRTGYFTSCSSNYDTCFKNLTCRSSKCICPSTKAYNSASALCVDCNSGWYGFDDRCYLKHTSSVTWDIANSTCTTSSSWLYIPSSTREMYMIDSLFNNDDEWVGIYTTIPNLSCNNPWYAVTSYDTASIIWDSNQPNCYLDSQYCAVQTSNTALNDRTCSDTYQYACEYAP